MKCSEFGKTILRSLIRVTLATLAGIIKQKENKILFHSMPDATDNSWHLYRYMSRHLEGKHFVWLCESPPSVAERIEKHNRASANRVSVVRNRSLLSFFHFCSSEYIFVSHGMPSFLPVLRRAVIVNLWHGMPIKPIEFLNKKKKTRFVPYSYVLSTSDFFSPIMADAFRVPLKTVMVTGLPRNDALLKEDPDARRGLESALNIGPDTGIVFWLPTYRNSYVETMPADSDINSFIDEWSESFWERVSAAATEARKVVVIKLHTLDILNEQERRLHQHAGIRFVSRDQWAHIGIDLYDALAVASALVTDLSSVLIDYAVTQRPMAVTCRSLDRYSRGMISGTKPILSACYQITDEATFIDFLRSPQANPRNANGFTHYNKQVEDREVACRSIIKRLGIAPMA